MCLSEGRETIKRTQGHLRGGKTSGADWGTETPRCWAKGGGGTRPWKKVAGRRASKFREGGELLARMGRWGNELGIKMRKKFKEAWVKKYRQSL